MCSFDQLAGLPSGRRRRGAARLLSRFVAEGWTEPTAVQRQVGQSARPGQGKARRGQPGQVRLSQARRQMGQPGGSAVQRQVGQPREVGQCLVGQRRWSKREEGGAAPGGAEGGGNGEK